MTNLHKVCITALLGLCFSPVFAQLYINEIMASNALGPMDDFFDHDDWIEIYNAGGLLDISGYYLTDNPSNLTKWQFPTDDCYAGDMFITPGSHFIVWADKDTIVDPCFDSGQGPTHTNFTLSSEGETVLLVAPDGTTIIDSISYPQMAADISYGRSSDGAATWQYFNNYTFEDTNGELPQDASTLFINEVQSLNSSTFADPFDEFDPWIEIYNPNNFQVNLGGYYLSNSGDALQWLIPNTNPYRTVVPANGFLLIWFDGQPEQDSNHTSMALDGGGGTVTLTSPDGLTTVDSYTYPALANDVSWGRSSDGNPNSIVFSTPTPTVTNTLIIIESPELFINELMAVNHTDTVDNFLEHDDWFEVYNPNDFEVDLEGYYFSDNLENPMKWQVPATFPDSVTVDAHGWLLFWADEDGGQGVRHASFRLNNQAEQLRMYTPDGFSLVDAISWVGLAPDTSYGRMTDGNETWWLFTGTTPEYSNNEGELHSNELADLPHSIRLWPNPATNYLVFSQRTDVVIRNLMGSEVLRADHVERMSIEDLPSGSYFVSVNGQVLRLVVQ